MSTNNSQFFQTRDMFREYLSGYPKNLTYAEWKSAAADDKAVLLYVTFFNEVTLAWFNAITSRNIVFVTQEDAISIVLQYLMKNVPKIEESEKRYTSNYIYKICYNCIGCLPRSVSGNERAALELSNEFEDGDICVNLWDLVPSEDDDLETLETKEAIWNVIRHMGPKAEKVVNHLINPKEPIHRTPKSSPEYEIDRLAEVSVSSAEYDAIIAELKVKLAPFKDVFLSF